MTMAMMRFRFLKGFWNFPALVMRLLFENFTKRVAAIIMATVARVGRRTLKNINADLKTINSHHIGLLGILK